MNIYIASLINETNTFSPNLTGFTNFQRGYFLKGSEIRSQLGDTNTELSGFLEELERHGDVNIIPGIAAWAVPSGRVKDEFIQGYIIQLLDDIQKHSSLDGILLALHGALVSESIDDCEGYLLEQVRAVATRNIKIICTLDYHAVLTQAMVEAADLIVGYRTYPHVDFKETGMKAANRIRELILLNISPVKCYGVLPLVLPVENTETGAGPMSYVIQRMNRLDEIADIFHTSLFCPQPWLDIRNTGVSIVSYLRDERMRGEVTREIQSLLLFIWDVREQFFSAYPSVSHVIEYLQYYEKPVILVDSGDIITGGGSGDSTVILKEIMSSSRTIAAIIPIVDPVSVDQAFILGTGSRSVFELGGDDSDVSFNKRIRVQASIVRLTDEDIRIQGKSFAGLRMQLGRRAVLRLENECLVIVSEYPCMIHDAEFLRSLKVEPERQELIVQKSHKLFRDSYRAIAKTVIIADTPGYTDLNLKRLKFRNMERPVYPFNDAESNDISIKILQ